MCLKAKIMRLFVVAVTLSFTFLEISNSSESHDRNSKIQKEVEDFKEFLNQKFEKEAISKEKFETEWSGEISEEYLDHDHRTAEQNGNAEESDIFDSLQDESSHSFQHSGEAHPPEETPKTSLGSPSNPEKKTTEATPNEQHHPVEEILFIRRTDSESKDPIAEVLDTLVHGNSADEAISPSYDLVADAESTKQDNNGPSADVPCQIKFSSSHHETCPDGPEYDMHFPRTYSKILKQNMKKMLPERDQNENKCDYGKELTANSSVEDRALCPFKWSISSRNPHRIPEYLFEAKCSCQLSRNGKKCVEMKKVLPVLLVTNCRTGTKKRYKQVWQEITVACVPVEEREGHVLHSEVDNMR